MSNQKNISGVLIFITPFVVIGLFGLFVYYFRPFNTPSTTQDFDVTILILSPIVIIYICEYQIIEKYEIINDKFNIVLKDINSFIKSLSKKLLNFIKPHIYFDTVFIFISFILMLCTIFYFGFYIQP